MTIPFAQVLTEVCDNGSIFDLFSKCNTTLKLSTAWRIARECAGYWHTRHKVFNHNFDVRYAINLSVKHSITWFDRECAGR